MTTQNSFQQLRALMPLLLPSKVVSCNDRCLELLSETGWVALAEQFDLAAAFFMALRDRKLLPKLSPLAREKLEQAYKENTVRQVILSTLLARILDVLQPLSKPPILLKGLAYAYELYPDSNARIGGDIDLMIESEEVDAALEQLIRIGFSHIPQPPIRLGTMYRLAWSLGLKSSYEQLIHRIKGPSRQGETWLRIVIGGVEIRVDIHYSLFNVVPLIKGNIFHAHPEFEGSTRTLSLDVGEVRVIDYESAFLYALRHLVLHHRFIGLRWHYDLALMLLVWRDHLKPEDVLEHARMLGSHKIVRVELAILEELFGPMIFRAEDRERWLKDRLPVGYPICRWVALRGIRTPLEKFIRPLLAPSFKEQIIVAFT